MVRVTESHGHTKLCRRLIGEAIQLKGMPFYLTVKVARGHFISLAERRWQKAIRWAFETPRGLPGRYFYRPNGPATSYRDGTAGAS